MPGKFIGLGGVDLELAYVNDYAIIDEFARTGSLWSWGANGSGALGANNTLSRSSPVQTVSTGTNWKQLSYSGNAGACVKTDGTLWLWGQGTYGALGNNATTARSSPVQTVSAGTNWAQVSFAGHCAAIKTDGTLWLWGGNFTNNGELGNNATTNRSSPVQTVSTGSNWKQVSCGSSFTGAIKTDGTLWTWGANSSGQLGDNTNTNKSSPVQTVSSTTNWKQVACGFSYMAAIKTDGTLWMWGANGSGQLGNNSTLSRSSPVQTVSGGTNWKQVSSKGFTTACVKTDGTLWLWGSNYGGRLGDNTIINKSSPVQTVSAGTNWKQASAGSNIVAAIKTDGTLWTWGLGNFGQIGNNSTLSRSSPVQTVSGGTNWKQVDAGSGQNNGAIYFYDAGNLYPNS
jgi:alpha-tubulin suppressor-like RCC1 family protein